MRGRPSSIQIAGFALSIFGIGCAMAYSHIPYRFGPAAQQAAVPIIAPAILKPLGDDVAGPAATPIEDNGEATEALFHVYVDSNHKQARDFATFAEALAFAKQQETAEIIGRRADRTIWSNRSERPDTAFIEAVPQLMQLPELERGCEVTSLAMLLGYDGIDVDKMNLADEVKKDPTPLVYDEDGVIHYGNPNDGFVGDIATFNESGYGVYHGPIFELASQYADDRAVDLTGVDFDDLLIFVGGGRPVWVIANGAYEPLDDDMFETWDTPSGPVIITYMEHSVVITGYTENTVILNDPVAGEIYADRELFAAAWAQMGSQAIVLLSPDDQAL